MHEIIKRDMQLQKQYYIYQGGPGGGLYPNQQLIGVRIMSNQPSPTKGLYEQYENYKGIDLSSQRSPFKQMNKQL